MTPISSVHPEVQPNGCVEGLGTPGRSYSKVVIREARCEEEELRRLYPLCRGYLPKYGQCTLEAFEGYCRGLWQNNPARLPDQVFGWLIENGDGEIGGFLGVIPMKMKVGASEIPAIGGHSWIVKPAVRLYSIGLYQRILTLSQRYFLVVAAGGETVNAIGNRQGASITRVPVQGFDQQFSWVLDPAVVLQWALEKHGEIRLAHLTESSLLRAILKGALWLGVPGRHRLRFRCASLSVEPVDAATSEFDELWNRAKGDYGVTIVRDSAFVAWRHFLIPNLLGQTSVLGCWEGGSLRGYVAIQRRAEGAGYPAGHYVVTDLFYERSREDVLMNLINAAYEFAQHQRASLFQFVNMSAEVAELLRTQRPHVRTLAHWPYWYRAPSPDLAAVCQQQPWWPSGADGEAGV